MILKQTVKLKIGIQTHWTPDLKKIEALHPKYQKKAEVRLFNKLQWLTRETVNDDVWKVI